jgi:tetratricopeptide (TPR) repeat protein
VLAAAVILVLLVGGIVGTTLGLARAVLAEREANAQRVLAVQERDDKDQARKEAVANAERAEVNFKQARAAVDDMYTQIAEKWLAHQPRLEPLQREFLQKALRFYEQFAYQTSSKPVMRFESARAYRRAADIQYKLGDTASAEKAYHQAIQLLQALVDSFPNRPEYQKELADALLKLGTLLGDTGRQPEMEEVYRRSLVLQRKLVADFAAEPDYRRDLARGLHTFVFDVQSSERWQFNSQAIALQQKLAVELASVPEVRAELAASLRWRGNHSTEGRGLLRQAVDLLEKLVAQFPGDPAYREGLAASHFSLAMALPSPGAEKALDNAIDLLEKLIADFPAVNDYRSDLSRNYGLLGLRLTSAGKVEEAEKAYRRALVVAKQLRAVPKVDYFRDRLANIQRDLGDLLTASGRFAEAEKEYRELIALRESLLADYPDDYQHRAATAVSEMRLGSVLAKAGCLQEAEKARGLALTAVAILEKWAEELPKDPAARRRLASRQNIVAWKLATDPDPKVGDVFAAVAVKLANKAVESAPKDGSFWNTLGTAHYRAGNWKPAIDATKKSLEYGLEHDLNWFILSMAHWQLGKKQLARRLYTLACRRMDNNNPNDVELRQFRREAAALMGLPVKVTLRPQQPKSEDLDLYTLMLETDPMAAWVHYQRGALYAGRGQWDKADTDFSKAVELKPDELMHHYSVALARLGAGDLSGYRGSCVQLLKRFGQTMEPNAAYWVAWTALLAPQAVKNVDQPINLAEKAVRDDPKNDTYSLTFGAALYRAGRIAEAINCLNEVSTRWEQAKTIAGSSTPAYIWFFLAMAHHQSGHNTEARTCLDKAIECMEQEMMDPNTKWNRRLTLRMLRREAEELVKKSQN